MHNRPGWSSSGGPWITPELSMQRHSLELRLLSAGGRDALRRRTRGLWSGGRPKWRVPLRAHQRRPVARDYHPHAHPRVDALRHCLPGRRAVRLRQRQAGARRREIQERRPSGLGRSLRARWRLVFRRPHRRSGTVPRRPGRRSHSATRRGRHPQAGRSARRGAGGQRETGTAHLAGWRLHLARQHRPHLRDEYLGHRRAGGDRRAMGGEFPAQPGGPPNASPCRGCSPSTNMRIPV